MPRFNHIQNSFSSGELSKKLYGRTDIDEYRNGAERVENFQVVREGGVRKRSGFEERFAWEAEPPIVKSSLGDRAAMIPYSVGDNVFMVVLNQNDDRQIENTIMIYDTRDFHFIDVMFTTMPNGDNSLWAGWTGAANIEGNGYDYVQFGTNLIITHNSGYCIPIIISPFLGNNDEQKFSVTLYMPIRNSNLFDPGAFMYPHLRVPYEGWNTDLSTITLPSKDYNTELTATASGAVFINANPPTGFNFMPYYMLIEDEGATNGPAWAWILVTSHVDGGLTQAKYYSMWYSNHFRLNVAHKKWQRSAWGGSNFYPRTCTMFQQRLIWGGSPSMPDTIWASFTNNPWFMNQFRIPFDGTNGTNIKGDGPSLGFSGDAQEADPFDVIIGSDEISTIQWMNSGREIQIGTASEEYVMGNVDQFFSVNNSFIARRSSIGSLPIPAVGVEGKTIFVSSNGKKVYQFSQAGSRGSQEPKNLTILSEDIINHGSDENSTTDSMATIALKKVVWQSSENTLWVLNTHNHLIGLTLSSSSGVLGWHRHTVNLPGNEKILDVQTMPNPYGLGDVLYLLTGSKTGNVSNDHLGTAKILQLTIPSEQNTLEFDLSSDLQNKVVNFNSIHNYLDSSYTQIHNGLENNRLMVTSSSYFYLNALNNSAIFNMTYQALDIRFHTEAFSQGKLADRIAHGFWWGHPIEFLPDSLPGNADDFLPPELDFNTPYYLIPLYRQFNWAITAESPLPYLFRLAASEADALAGNYISFSNPTIPPFLLHMQSHASANPNWINMPFRKAPTGDTEDIRVIMDGKDLGDRPMDEWGRIDLGEAFNNWTIAGGTYNSYIRTMDIDVGSQLGSSLESISRIDRIMPILHKTKDLQFGSENDLLDEVDFDFTDNPTLLESKKPIMFLPQSPDSEVHVILQSNKPLPCTILALSMRGTQHDS